MALLITILAAMSSLFGIRLLFSPAERASNTGAIRIGSGVHAHEAKFLNPLPVGLELLWQMRPLGVKQRR
jgi:hypothetical protein